MSKQENILKTSLAEWQSHKDDTGNTYEQVDDILVIGIKV